jgi:hypothetical protein
MYTEWETLWNSLQEGKLKSTDGTEKNVLAIKDILLLDNLAYFRPLEQYHSYDGYLLKEFLKNFIVDGVLDKEELFEKLHEQEKGLYKADDKTTEYINGEKVVLPFGGTKADMEIMFELIDSSTAIRGSKEDDYGTEPGLTVIYTMDDYNGGNGGITAMCLMDADNNIYVIYRGTSGGAAWKDNIMAMTELESELQLRAYDFYKESISKAESQLGTIGQVIVSGHSKGGNLAKYVTIRAEHDILNDHENERNRHSWAMSA